MEKPREVQFRDLEAQRLDEAFEAWREWPSLDMEQALREAVANYVHAQALVADLIQTMQIVSGMDAAIAQGDVRKKIDAAGL